ncbi:MAG: heme ABC exporter ATP-binding protein CcmA [candidate division Zixibacteria bacterium]|nr:heme ABC exporter ATP-binding protein CcmA [candidate division Zixibacteria bacterium]
MYGVEVNKLSKRFGTRRVLEDVSFSLSVGDSLAVVGKNGSGKTTLLKILAGLAAPTRGTVTFSNEKQKLDRAEVRQCLSYVGPELTLYDFLTAAENLTFFAAMRGTSVDTAWVETMLAALQLGGRGGDFYGAYSSGMKQRLKYAVALLNDPVYLLLDEPTANLDDEGKKIVAEIIARQKKNGIVIVATNEAGEYGFADKLIRLGN